MILKDNLYTVTSMDRENARVDVALVPDNVIYRAHFPERAVTPGVCIVRMAVELLSALLRRECTLPEVPNAKFLSIVSPQDTPCVSFAFSKIISMDDGNATKANVAVTASTGAVCARLTILCRAS